MDAFYIINKKTKEILLSKEYNSSNNPISKVNSFLCNIDKSIIPPNAQTPFLKLDNSLIIYYSNDYSNQSNPSDLLYLIIISNEDIYVPSYLHILKSIDISLTSAFKEQPTPNLIKDNLILILLMLDQYILNGVPLFNDNYVLTSLVSPYGFTDKISEKLIGIAKNYNTDVLKEYITNLQMNQKGEMFKYIDESKTQQQQILFDFIDYISITTDKKSNVINNKCYSEININSKIKENVDLNILLNIPYEVNSFCIDRSVKTKKKDIIKKKNMDCICKHGIYTLMRIVPQVENSFIQLPFKITTETTVTNSKINLFISIVNSEIKGEYFDIDNIKINIKFNIDYNYKVKNINLAANIGDFEFSENNSEAFWSIKRLSTTNGEALMKGSAMILSDNQNIGCNCVLSMSCLIEKFSLTGGNLVKVNLPEKWKNVISKFHKRKTIIDKLDII